MFEFDWGLVHCILFTNHVQYLPFVCFFSFSLICLLILWKLLRIGSLVGVALSSSSPSSLATMLSLLTDLSVSLPPTGIFNFSHNLMDWLLASFFTPSIPLHVSFRIGGRAREGERGRERERGSFCRCSENQLSSFEAATGKFSRRGKRSSRRLLALYHHRHQTNSLDLEEVHDVHRGGDHVAVALYEAWLLVDQRRRDLPDLKCRQTQK